MIRKIKYSIELNGENFLKRSRKTLGCCDIADDNNPLKFNKKMKKKKQVIISVVLFNFYIIILFTFSF